MRIVLVDDDVAACDFLGSILGRWGYDVVVGHDGNDAWHLLRAAAAPKLAILDWIMPHLDGLEVCRKVRELPTTEPTYILLVTGNGTKEAVVAGLEAGADDFVVKPYDLGELRARLQVGRRLVELQSRLADQVRRLELSLGQVKQLQGLLPICCFCKKIRDDKNYWQQVEGYIAAHTNAQFSHGICPDCYHSQIAPQLIAAGVEPPELHDIR
jgi:sigma-B regulation protein RsbU (phosphoserine phosphatase)